MKKCSYCAEEVQEEATICRFCSRNLKNSPVSTSSVILTVLLLCFFVAAFVGYSFLSKQSYQSAQFQSERLVSQRELATSVCLEINRLVNFAFQTRTLGETQEIMAELIPQYNELKKKVILEVARPDNNQILMNQLMSLLDEAIYISDIYLRHANYVIENEEVEQMIGDIRQRAQKTRELAKAGQHAGLEVQSYWSEATRLDQEANKALGLYRAKENMISEMRKKLEEAVVRLADKIREVKPHLARLDIDPLVVFSSAQRTSKT